MTSVAPDGSARLVPRIFTDDPVGLVAFIRTAFEATAEVVSCLVVGRVDPQTASLNLYVREDQPYGERRAMVQDRWSNTGRWRRACPDVDLLRTGQLAATSGRQLAGHGGPLAGGRCLPV